MDFVVRIATDEIQAEPGSTAPVALVIDNREPGSDRFELAIEGLDPEWTAVPVPAFDVPGNSSGEQKFYVKPPRTSESLAGTYPFVVRVRSLKTGKESQVQGELTVKPYHHLSVDVQPRKGTLAPWKKQCPFQVTAMNLSNVEHTLQLAASDVENDLAFEFDDEQEAIGPGQQKEFQLSVTAARTPLLSSPRLRMFTATARSQSARSVAASAQAQVEQRAWITPGTLALAITIIVLLGAWIAFWPEPPNIQTFALSQSEVVQGEVFEVEWSSSNSSSVTLTFGSREITGLSPSGRRQLQAEEVGTHTVAIRAVKGDRQGPLSQKSVTVTEPEVAPEPTILSMVADPEGPLRRGEPFLIRYRFGPSVTEARLSPLSIDLDISDTAQRVVPERTGKITYRIIAKNKDGVVAERSITVDVVNVSDANIVVFRASPQNADPLDPVTLTWQVVDAVRVEIKFDDQVLDVSTTGQRNLFVDQTTEFTLVAFDEEGRTAESRLTVTVDDSSSGSGRQPPMNQTSMGDQR